MGKTSAVTDTYHGHYATLVPDQKVVEIDEFESADALHEGVPESVPAADNQLGWELSLSRLAALVE